MERVKYGRNSTRNMNIDLRNQIIIVIAGAFFFMPFLGRVHLFDWDEANFAEASREMIVSKNYMQVQIDYKPFWEKPPLFFWLQTLSMKAFGVNEFSARFVNALFGIFTLLIVYRIGRKLFDAWFGMFWAMAFLGSFLPHFFYKSGIIDPVFNLFIFLGVYFLSEAMWGERNRRLLPYFLSGIFIGLATLAKGPAAVIIITLCGFTYWASKRFVRIISIRQIIVFFGAVCLVSSLWYGLETILHGPWFVMEFVKYQAHLFTRGEAGHGRPFYFHPVVLLFGCFPASFLAIRMLFGSKKFSGKQAFFTNWMAILFWVDLVLFSIVKTKTVLYSSLTYFPITYLAVGFICSVKQGTIAWNKFYTIAITAFGLLVAAVIAVFPVVMRHPAWLAVLTKDKFALACLQYPMHWSFYEVLIGIGYGAMLVASFILAFKKKFTGAFSVLFLSTALCLQIFMIDMVPKMDLIAGGGPVEFYKSLCGKDCYVHSLFKSYVDLFYSQKLPGGNPESRNSEWLLKGSIDKPVYFVCRISKADNYRGKYGLIELKNEYGFVYFKREASKTNEEVPAK
ncbi:MAG TPA: glycosyl transferase [Fibrobacteres bacterium]|nr:glycosyl transferase [Fibrobacterota bacterium]